MKQLVEKCTEQRIVTEIVFINFEQTFDTVKRESIIRHAENLSVPEKIFKTNRDDTDRLESSSTTST